MMGGGPRLCKRIDGVVNEKPGVDWESLPSTAVQEVK